MKYKVIYGSFRIGNRDYVEGEVIETEYKLDLAFPDKCVLVGGEEKAGKAPKTDSAKKTGKDTEKATVIDPEEQEDVEEGLEEEEEVEEKASYEVKRIGRGKYVVVDVDGDTQHKEEYLSKDEAEALLETLTGEAE